MEISRKKWTIIFLGIAGCILFYWILHETERVSNVLSFFGGLTAPFAVGAGLAFVINVPMRSIERMLRGVPNEKLRRVLALLLTVVIVLLVLTLVFWLLIPQVMQTARSVGQKLPGFYSKIETFVTNFLKDNPDVWQWVVDNTDLENIDIAGLVQKAVDFIGNSVSTLVSGAVVAIGSVASAIFDAVISLVFAIYCLFRKEILARQGRRLLYAFFPEKFSDKVIYILRLANSTFSNFLSGQCVEVVILGCMFAITMAIFRMPYIPLISVLIAVTAFIPLVGAFVGCGFGALFILVYNLDGGNLMQVVWFVIMFLVLQQIENNLIYPRVVGTSIGLPGMWVLAAVSIGGELMGVSGMFLMIPLVSVLYSLLREYTNFRLEKREIPAEKLMDKPPELKSGFKESRERTKKARLHRSLKKEKAAKESNSAQKKK